MSAEDEEGASLTDAQYAAIAAFRHRLRRFLAFSEARAAAEGLPSQQHQVLLALAGRPSGQPASVGYLAEQLMVAPHTATELTARMVDAGLLTKTTSADDRRRAELSLTPRARHLLGRLTQAHLRELGALEPALVRALGKATSGLGREES